MTPPLSILILIHFLSLPSMSSSLPLLCVSFLTKNSVKSFHLTLNSYSSSHLSLSFYTHTLEHWKESLSRPSVGCGGGGKHEPNQISKYPISHIDKLISVQIK